MGIHFICVDIKELNINVFWHFYSSSPGVYTRLGFLFRLFFLSLLFFCTLKPLPSVIWKRGVTAVSGTPPFLSGLAAGLWHCPIPVPSQVAAALPRWDISKAGFWMCCKGVEGMGSCAHCSSLRAALRDGSLSPSLSPAFPQLPSRLELGRMEWLYWPTSGKFCCPKPPHQR